jgi:hypothetical protein
MKEETLPLIPQNQKRLQANKAKSWRSKNLNRPIRSKTEPITQNLTTKSRVGDFMAEIYQMFKELSQNLLNLFQK